jgi:cysteine desulfurase
MLPYFSKAFGNPQSQHGWGKEASSAIEHARESVSKLINAKSEEIFFTGSATESNNLALKGVVQALKNRGRHIISTPIEHLSILHPLKSLQKEGVEVTFLPVDHQGVISPEDVKKSIREDTILVSIIHGNNEIGTIEPIEQISKITRGRGVYLHTDASATMGLISLDVEALGVDLLTGSSQTLYGPKGVGVLYMRRGTRVRPIIEGGTQEHGKRSGTENVPAIVGFGKAAELAQKDMDSRLEVLVRLRDRIKLEIERKVEALVSTGSWVHRLPHHCSWCVKLIEGATLLSTLGEIGIGASSGSACSSQALRPSGVLSAIGIPEDLSKSSLVLSVGIGNTDEEVDFLVKEFPPLVKKLREMSPDYREMKR